MTTLARPTPSSPASSAGPSSSSSSSALEIQRRVIEDERYQRPGWAGAVRSSRTIADTADTIPSQRSQKAVPTAMPIPIGCVSLDLGMVPWARYCLTQGNLDAEGSQEIRNAVACTSVPPVLCDDDGDEAAAKRAGDASRQRLLDAAAAGTPLWSGSEALCKAASLWKAAVPAGSKAAMSSTAMSRLKFKKTKPNEPCPCGSGKKYKKCCSGKD